jgi:outer membrane protein OmpU
LVATAGVAAADVNLSGLARFGAQYVEGTAATGTAAQTAVTTAATANTAAAATVTANTAAGTLIPADIAAAATAATNLANAQAALDAINGTADATTMDTRFQLNIAGTAEADGGLTFGATVRMRANESGDNAGRAAFNPPRFTVSSGGLTVGAGNINGAIDSMPGLYGGTIGLTGLGFSNVVTNFGSDTYDSTGAGRNGIEVIYSMGDFGVHVSNSSTSNIERTALSVSYAVSGWTLALGYQDSNRAADAEWVATVGGALGAANVGLAVSQTHAGVNSMTLSGSFSVGAATTLTAYAATDDGQANKNAYGLGVVHNLGGGASIRGGVANTHGTNRADLGVQFNF